MEISELRERLKAHDWFYEWSDRGPAYARGHADRVELFNILGQMPGKIAMPLIQEFCPADALTPFMLAFERHCTIKRQNKEKQ